MFIDATTSRADLEAAIINEGSLYAMFDEARLLADGYSDAEYREVIQKWIEAGDECGRC